MAEEILDIVDENDTIIGQCTRKESYNKQHPNRIVFVVIKNTKGEIAIQRRSMKCWWAPWILDVSAWWHVSSGQEYFEAAERELFEEIWVECKLKLLWKEYLNRKELDKKYFHNMNELRHEDHFHFRCVYEWIYDGNFKFDDGEVEELLFFSLDTIRTMINTWEKMTPSLVDILEKYYFNKQ